MIKKTVYEFSPDDVDNALRTFYKDRMGEMRVVEADHQSFFGILLSDKDVQDACKAVVEKQVPTTAGTVWKFTLVRTENDRVSVSVSLT